MTKIERAQLEDIMSRIRTKANNSDNSANAGGWSKEHVAEYKGRTAGYSDSAILLKSFLNGTYKIED